MKTEKTAISEQWFRRFWQYQLLDSTALRTESGEPIRVLYPGRPNDLRGPDFRDAVIETDNGKFRGDVELHLQSGDWQTHRHHMDRHYNRVILHVVMRHNTKRGTVLENGIHIPVLALGNPDTVNRNRTPGRQQRKPTPCAGIGSCHGTGKLLSCLEAFGTKRFRGKAVMLAEKMRAEAPAEILYREIMEAMGYAANKTPFRELAERFPLSELDLAVSGRQDRDTMIRACLFGTAGFLRDEFQTRLAAAGIHEEQYRTLVDCWQQSGGTVRVPRDRWQLFRIRPNNAPFGRLASMCALLSRTGTSGFLSYLKSVVEAGLMITDSKTIENSLTALSVTNDTETGGRPAVLLGTARSRAIVVNVLLPFVFAVSGCKNETTLATCRSCKKIPENSLERHMREQFGLEKRAIKTVLQQQGLIHIYKTLCTQGKCDECTVRTFS